MNVVEMDGIYKSFGPNMANKNVNFTLRKGEVHALLGENGAGKSTLMSILYGLYSHDAGSIQIHGKPVNITTPNDAISHGIGMVHQHFMLIPQLTVVQNVFLGMKDIGFVLKIRELEKQVRNYSNNFGFNVDPKSLIWQIPVGVQQKVEIIKVLARKADIIILDEPTAVLTPNEVDELFRSIRALAREGYSIILITHKMREVLEFADRVTVMRDGEVTGTLEAAATTEDELARMMVGRSVSLLRKSGQCAPGKAILRVKNLCVTNDKGLLAVKNISFEVHAGEIVGIAGVDGNGQRELGEALIGGRKTKSGDILIEDKTLVGMSIKNRLEEGMAHIPDDRRAKGLILQFPVKDNLILGQQRKSPYSRGTFMDTAHIEEHADVLMDEFDIRPRAKNNLAGSFSGGNQQKVILAREVERKPRVMLANQPTRGLDIGAIEFVRSKLVEERDNQKAVLLVSTDLDEILSLSDRILVIHGGELMGEVSFNTPIEEIGLLMAGQKRGSAVASGEEGGTCLV